MSFQASNNATILNEVMVHGWMRSPITRGTTEILYSCLLTISACVYTSIHLNIPAPGEKQRQQVFRRIKWTVIAIFAPEYVLYLACRQYSWAKLLITRICKSAPEMAYLEPSWYQKCLKWLKLSSRSSSESIYALVAPEDQSQRTEVNTDKDDAVVTVQGQPNTRSSIDLTHGFFLAMGGIRVNTASIHKDVKSLAFTPEMLLDSIDPMLNSSTSVLRAVNAILVDRHTIKDRSKANNITKILICVQITGVAVQCIARKAAGLPLTLLELHTFAHVVCAICIYGAWFSKPLDVNEAIIIDVPEDCQVRIARLLMSCRPRKWCCQVFHTCGKRHHDHFHVNESHVKPGAQTPEVINGTYTQMSTNASHSYGLGHDCDGEESHLYTEAYINNEGEFMIKLPSEATGCSCAASDGLEIVTTPPVLESDKLRWKVASNREQDKINASAYRYYPPYVSRISNNVIDPKDQRFALSLDTVDWYDFEHLIEDFQESPKFTIIAFLIAGAYGAIHAVAWKYKLPSTPELWLWRSSCLVLISFLPMAYVLLRIMQSTHKALSDSRNGALVQLFCGVALIAMFGLMIGTAITYALARIFLVLEVFISLRVVPEGVYAAVPWSSFVPHI